ncbi:GNAT family N-acetyltransferase [Streptomyces sp. NPDC058052]|uniref:GNAT family N-acetyltransferase n=1 Tax=Streptomyces sp. NPDC058052 TaxID=3346316 RepID=UPI0036E1F468
MERSAYPHGDRLFLREPVAGDVPAVHGIYGSEAVTEHLSFEARSVDDVRGIVGRSIASARAVPREEYALVVVERATDALVGFVRLALDPHQQRAATVGFALRAESWGVGYGRETVGLLLDLAFGTLDLHRVWAARSPLNTASARTLLAAGFTEEGRIRGHVCVRGAWRDSVTYGILREEWDGSAIRLR